jgi:uncharacterized protein YvpB
MNGNVKVALQAFTIHSLGVTNFRLAPRCSDRLQCIGIALTAVSIGLFGGENISRKVVYLLLKKTSPFVLLAVGLLAIVAFVLSGCDLATGSSANALPTPGPSPSAVQSTPTTQPADPPADTPANVPTAIPPTDTAAPADTVAPPDTVPPADTTTDTSTPEPPTPPPTDTSQPTATDLPVAPAPTRTARPVLPTPTLAALQNSPTVEATPGAPSDATSEPAATSSGTIVNGQSYDAYVSAATKLHQYYHFTCEFDAAWVVLKTNGIDVTLADQLAITGQDKSIEPKYEETGQGVFIYGGDILHYYSGDYTTNFLARTTGAVMARLFEHYGLNVSPVHTQDALEAALRQGKLVWIKTTADFKPGKPATWVMPDGTTYQTVLGNDHAAVVMGYSDRGAHIRDVLGPTSTNENRQYEYDVPWPKFMAAWDQQQDDGLAVGP